MNKKLLAVLCIAFLPYFAFSQESGGLMSADTANMKKIFSTLKKIEFVGFSGYMQPQFQVIQSTGAKSYNGGDFSSNTNNRFMLRRGRFRVDYAKFTKDALPKLNFVFQFDGTERGFAIRDFWGRIYENKLNYFSVTTGMFARPMGFEINLSSGDRETPERGRMSQILMKTERDLGAMISFEPKSTKDWRNHIKIDFGLFNGQGLTSTADFDSHKDIISRVALKQTRISENLWLSGSVSGLFGGLLNLNGSTFEINGNNKYSLVSSTKIAPRKYRGADIQLRIPNKGKMFSEIRLEYISGIQSALQNSTDTPVSLPISNGVASPFYKRRFDGAYFYFLQHIGSQKNQLVAKYDWYDPNKKLSGLEIDDTFSEAEVKYNTVGLGLIRYVNENLKVVFYYELPKNESTNKKEYKRDSKDNSFSTRIQYRF